MVMMASVSVLNENWLTLLSQIRYSATVIIWVYLGRGAVGGSETGWGTAGTGLKPLRMSPSSRTSDVFGTLALLDFTT